MLVSVIIPVYNAESYIARCVTSVLDQSYANLEVILVDDCSTDSTLSVLRGVLDERNDSRVRLICHERNQGSAAARTTGINAAHGDYMIHVDCDDWVEPDFIAKMTAKAMDCNADIVVCEFNYVYADRNEWKHIPEPANVTDFLAHVLDGSIHASLCNKLIRSSIINDYKLRPLPGVNILDDKSMLYKVAYYARTIAYVHEPLYCYNRCNAASYTSVAQDMNATVAKNEAAYVAVLADMSAFFKANGCHEQVVNALVQFRLFVMGLLLLHGSSCSVIAGNADLFEGVGLASVWRSHVQLHYKLADTLCVLRLMWLVRLLRLLMRAANKLKRHVQ